MLFVPTTVWEWYERFQYREKFPHTAKEFDQVDPRFHAFERTYRSRLSDYRARMAEQGGVN